MRLQMMQRDWVVYLIRCADNSLYCGITNHLKNRLAAHNSGKGAKYTRARRPVRLVGISSLLTKSHALKLEHSVKQVPAGKKLEKLLEGQDAVDADLLVDMYFIKEELRILTLNIEKLRMRIEKIGYRHSGLAPLEDHSF